MMKKTLLFLSFPLFLSNYTYSQLTVSPYNNGTGNNGSGGNLQQFVQNNLVGSGIVISNVTFTGANRQAGSFNSTNTMLFTNQGMDDGIILSTGEVITAVGPNDEARFTGILGAGTTVDPDLRMLIGSSDLYDNAILQFDFVPQGSSIEFKYIFGSEEYPEFVGSIYNDVFGFFLSGPGISGTFSNSAINLALIPNTSTPVAINNVNGITNTAYYVYNGDDGDGEIAAPYKDDVKYIEYDGYTITLTAKAQVQCGKTYRLKIVIGDVSDNELDSGVFLKGGSLISEVPAFTNPGPVCSGTIFTLPATSNNGIAGTWSPAVNNAVTTTYTFTPNNAVCSSPTTMTVVVSNQVVPAFTNPGPVCSGTAFTLPATSNNGIAGTWSPAVNNTATTTYTFTPANTGCSSPTTMTVVVSNQVVPAFTNPGPVCSGTAFTLPATSNNGIAGTWSPAVNNTATTTYTFTPANTGCASSTTMTVVVNNQVVPAFTNPGPVCSGTAFTLPATSNNGIAGTWSPVVNNTATTTYTFTPANTGCSSPTTMTVVVSDQVVPAFTNLGPVCSGTSFTLPATSNNGIAGTWLPEIDNTATTTYTFTPANTGCTSSTTMTVVVGNEIVPTFTNPGPVCQGIAFALPATSNNGIAGTWSPAVNNTATTTYTFTPANTGCASPTNMIVVVNPNFEISLSGGTNVCEGGQIPAILMTAVGGTAPFTFTYAVDNGANVTVTPTQNTATIDLVAYPGFNINAPGCHDLTIGGNATGACLTGNIVFTDYFCVYPKPDASFSVGPGNDGIHPMINTSTGASSYKWSFGDGTANSYLENPTHKFPNETAGDYAIELVAYSDKGCTDTAYRTISIEEELIIYVPNAFTPDGDQHNNVFKPVMTSGYDPYNYQLEIYDRWGECIFVSKNAEVGWDGTYGDEMVQDGVYVWKIILKVKHHDDKKVYEGHVSMIR